MDRTPIRLQLVAAGFCFSVGIAVGIVGFLMGGAACVVLIQSSIYNTDSGYQNALITTEKAQNLVARQKLLTEVLQDVKCALYRQVWTFYRPKQSVDGIVFWYVMKQLKPVLEPYMNEIQVFSGIVRFLLGFLLGVLLHYNHLDNRNILLA